MSSFLNNLLNNLSDTEKNKLGKSGSKINMAGSHAVSVVSAFEGSYEGKPNFSVTFETADGRNVEWTGYLTSKVGKDNEGKVKAGMYSVNGVQTQLDNEGDEFDNLKTIGIIKNLWKITGLPEAEFGSGIQSGTVKSYGKDITADVWTSLVGKQLTIVTSFEVSADKKDHKTTWRSQKVSMTNLFNKDGLSQFELDEGKTEAKAINVAVKTAKLPAAEYADIGYGIKYSDKNNASCKQEIKLIAGAGQVPKTEVVGVTDSVEEDDLF